MVPPRIRVAEHARPGARRGAGTGAPVVPATRPRGVGHVRDHLHVEGEGVGFQLHDAGTSTASWTTEVAGGVAGVPARRRSAAARIALRCASVTVIVQEAVAVDMLVSRRRGGGRWRPVSEREIGCWTAPAGAWGCARRRR